MRSIYIACLLLPLAWGIFPGRAAAQSAEITRLHTTVREAGRGVPSDTAYVDTLNRLARAYYGRNADSAFFYGRRALDYAGWIAYRRGEAESWRMLGNTYEMVGDYLHMLSSYHRSQDIAQQLGNTALIAKVDINMALFYRQEGEYDRAQRLMKEVEDLDKQSGDSVQIAYVASNLADLDYRQGQYDQALQYGWQALRIVQHIKDEKTAASDNVDIGRILAAKGDYSLALDHYLQSMTYYREAKDRLGVTSTNSVLAEVYLSLKDYGKALLCAQESLQEARALGRKIEIQGSAGVLARIYEAKGDYKHALEYFQVFKNYSDSLFNDQSHRELISRAAQYDYEEQASKMQYEHAVEVAGYERALRKDAVQIAITVCIIAVLVLLAFILWRSRFVNRRMNRLLREKNEKIEEQKETLEMQAVQLLLNNQQKDKLFSVVAHDLRVPLNSLKAVLDFLREKRLSEQEIGGMMAELRRHVDAGSELVSSLLFWASSQLNGEVVNRVLLPVDELVLETLELFAQPAREKNIVIKAERSGLIGYADKDMMQVVIRNLLSNAIKFCMPGGIVTVIVKRKMEEIEINVLDTGVGMTWEDLDRIRRKESFTSYGTVKEKGTGLGILLCHQFAEANGGRFFVESEWGKGSRCYFTIPAPPSSSSIRL
jgi:two-component system, sensor histidine kinase and response regulator